MTSLYYGEQFGMYQEKKEKKSQCSKKANHFVLYMKFNSRCQLSDFAKRIRFGCRLCLKSTEYGQSFQWKSSGW